MKSSDGIRNRTLIIICLGLVVLVSLPWVSLASVTSTSVNVVNNSGKGIVNVYTSHVNSDDWSADILGEGTIAPGQSSTLNNLTCDQQQIRVIAEDQDGCFLYMVVSCGNSATWTITNDSARDCGN